LAAGGKKTSSIADFRPPIPSGGEVFVILPKRWIVERTFAWISKYRRHSKDDERNPLSGKTMIPIAMTAIPATSKRILLKTYSKRTRNLTRSIGHRREEQ
jgi:heme/copper-type cytochrome/quinol oxidase subunit 2